MVWGHYRQKKLRKLQQMRHMKKMLLFLIICCLFMRDIHCKMPTLGVIFAVKLSFHNQILDHILLVLFYLLNWCRKNECWGNYRQKKLRKFEQNCRMKKMFPLSILSRLFMRDIHWKVPTIGVAL